MKEDREIVLAAVRQNGNALKHAGDTMKNDAGVVLAAVRQNGDALKHAGDTMKNDAGVVLAAASQNWRALIWANLHVFDDIRRNEIRTAARAQWRVYGDAAEIRRVECRFTLPSGKDIVEAGAWDKALSEIAEILWKRGHVASYSMKFMEYETTLTLDSSVVPYPKEVCSFLEEEGNEIDEPKHPPPPAIVIMAIQETE
jgi:hypothetical protein